MMIFKALALFVFIPGSVFSAVTSHKIKIASSTSQSATKASPTSSPLPVTSLGDLNASTAFASSNISFIIPRTKSYTFQCIRSIPDCKGNLLQLEDAMLNCTINAWRLALQENPNAPDILAIHNNVTEMRGRERTMGAHQCRTESLNVYMTADGILGLDPRNACRQTLQTCAATAKNSSSPEKIFSKLMLCFAQASVCELQKVDRNNPRYVQLGGIADKFTRLSLAFTGQQSCSPLAPNCVDNEGCQGNALVASWYSTHLAPGSIPSRVTRRISQGIPSSRTISSGGLTSQNRTGNVTRDGKPSNPKSNSTGNRIASNQPRKAQLDDDVSLLPFAPSSDLTPKAAETSPASTLRDNKNVVMEAPLNSMFSSRIGNSREPGVILPPPSAPILAPVSSPNTPPSAPILAPVSSPNTPPSAPILAPVSSPNKVPPGGSQNSQPVPPSSSGDLFVMRSSLNSNQGMIMTCGRTTSANRFSCSPTNQASPFPTQVRGLYAYEGANGISRLVSCRKSGANLYSCTIPR